YYRNQILSVTPTPGDVNHDTYVDIQDLTLMANNWLTAGPTGDANHDGIVDIQDVTLAANYWSPGPMGGGGSANQLLSPTPEPSTLALAGSVAAVALFAAARRRFRR